MSTNHDEGPIKYQPTPEERAALGKASDQFLKTYVFGIIAGFGAGYALSKYPRIQANKILRTTSIFGAGMAGEFLGRSKASQQAKDILNRELPSSSKLRELMDARERGHGGVLKMPVVNEPSSPFITKPPQQSQQTSGVSSSQDLQLMDINDDDEDDSDSMNNDLVGKAPANENPWDRLRRQSQQVHSAPNSQSINRGLEKNVPTEKSSMEPVLKKNSTSARYNQYGDEIL